MASRTAPFTAPALCLGAALLLAGCANTGVGVGASNSGASVGVSVGSPGADRTPRGQWPALPPPQLMTPEQIKAARQEPDAPSASPSGSTATSKP